MFGIHLIWLLIPLVALVALILGAVLIVRQQRKVGPSVPVPVDRGVGSGFDQSAGESREDFVRRHRDRPGIVANGVTLVDLYDRIRQLEDRLAAIEDHGGSKDSVTP